MQVVNKVIINAPIDNVWTVLADEFDKIDVWSSNVPKSDVNTEASAVDGAPVAGRICVVNGPAGKTLNTSENILAYDKANYTVKFNVIPTSGFMPIKENIITASLKKTDGGTELTWVSEPQVNGLAKLLAPFMKGMFRKMFGVIIDDFKIYVETGTPSERKQKALQTGG